MNFEDWYNGKLEKLQESIGYFFDDPTLLRMALLHSSFTHEHGGNDHNERLEFLGDSVLQLSASHLLFISEKQLDEGALSRRRAALVCGNSLRRWAEFIDIPTLLRTGKGMSGGTVRSSIYEDAAEALFGAVFLDGGYTAADAVILRYLDFLLFISPPEPADPKTELQILAQERGIGIPSYEILSVTGPSHQPLFHVRVLLGGSPAGEGRGTSKKAAEFNAAREGYTFFTKETATP